MELVERLEMLAKHYGLSVRGVAIKCGLKQQTMFKYFKGISVPTYSTFVKLAESFPEVSIEWLLLGTGNMLKEENKDIKRISSLLDTIATLQEAINMKEQTIAVLSAENKELENKLKTK